jgi:hypothetical protein
MALNWSGWVGAAATCIGTIPPLVGMIHNEPSTRSTTGNTNVQNYFLLWQDGARQIAGMRPATVTPVAEVQKPIAEPEPIAEPAPKPGSYYIDSLIRAAPGGASFDKNNYAQAGLTIENISGKDLLLAVEISNVAQATAISNLGSTSKCSLEGLKPIQYIQEEPDLLKFSRLAPRAKVSVSITDCREITSKDKAKSLSVNIPLLTIENEKLKQFSVALNDIPISQ